MTLPGSKVLQNWGQLSFFASFITLAVALGLFYSIAWPSQGLSLNRLQALFQARPAKKVIFSTAPLPESTQKTSPIFPLMV